MKRRRNRVSACKALLCFMAFGLASPTVSAAPVISATKKATISNDVNSNGMANPGDTLKYTVTIKNTGDMSGTNDQFTDTLDPNTTLVPGSVKATPIAANDNYTISGNTNLDSMFITAANGLLVNDSDPDGGPVSATPQNSAATTQGGAVDVHADGSFEYFPKPGNSTTDTFSYTITDDEGMTDTGTASIMFPEVIWYVDSSKPNGNGTSGSPFNNLASAAAASGPGHMIYVLTGSSVTGPNTGITLDNNESLVGQGVDLVVTFNGTPQTLYAAGTPPVIGTPVALAQNNTIKGLNIGDSGNPVAGTGISGTSYGTLTVSDARVTTSGGPALNLATGTLNNASFASLSSTSSSGRGLSITGSSGTLSITGATAISTPVTEGVLLSTNTGTFNFGGMTITNTGNTGFSASSGGTVNVTGSANTIATTAGTALNLTNTTIGASGITFRSISASGATNGIVLNNTGTSGGFTVTGTGMASSGGTIQNIVGAGILLSSTQSPSFGYMNIQTTGGSGVNGTLVNNFSFTNGTVNNAGDAGQESAIAFNGNGSLVGNNIAGTLTVTGNAFTNPFYSGLDVQSDNGTVSNANVSNNTITNPGFSGINFVGTGNTATAFNLNDATINQNNISGTGGNGIQISISNANATGPGATGGIPNDANNRIEITNNSITAIDATGTQAITVANAGGNSASRTRTNFLIECNGKNTGGCTAPTASPLASSAIGNVLLIGNNGYSTMTGTVNNNAITATHTPNLGGGNGISGGNGVSGALGNVVTPDLTLTVTNNTISGTDGNGILLVGRGTSGIAKMKITGNTVGASVNAGGSARQGIRVDAGNGGPTGSLDDAVCVTISSNTSAGSNGGAGIGIRKEGAVATTNDFGITGLSPSPATGAEAAAFVATQNPAGGGVDDISGAAFTSCATAPP